MSSWMQPLTIWLHTHPTWAILVVALVSFLESLAIIGTVIPGSVTLTAFGLMMGTGVIPLYPSLTAAIIGAIVGDTISYGLGYHYQQSIKSHWPFNRYPKLIKNGELFFKKHGGKSIFIGRFIGPIRATLPMVAGMLEMSFSWFLVSDVLSAMVWAPSYMIPGMLIGAVSLELPPETATHLILYLLSGLILLWIVVWILKSSLIFILNFLDRILARFWQYCLRHPHLAAIPPKLHYDLDGGHRQLAFLLIALISCLVFFTIAITPSLHGDQLNLNRIIFTFFQNLRAPSLDRIVFGVTYLGSKNIIFFAVATLAICMLWQKAHRAAFFLICNTVATALTIDIAKNILRSPRPDAFVMKATSFSLPSGHTSISMALIMFLTWIFCRKCPAKIQFRASIMSMCLIILIALSRLYLGDHWFTDIIAGFAVGAFWASLSAMVMDFSPSPPLLRLPLLATFSLSFTLAYAAYSLQNYQKDVQKHQWQFAASSMSMSQWWAQSADTFPRYREDRFGFATDILNLQWIGSSEAIISDLKMHGWQEAAPYTFLEWIKRINSTNQTQTLPVIPDHLYYRRADLILIKTLNDEKPLLVLQLWKSPHQILDSQFPLWIGKIEYRLVWHHHWLNENQAMIAKLPHSHHILQKDTASWQQRTIKMKSDRVLTHTVPSLQEPIVMLLQPK